MQRPAQRPGLHERAVAPERVANVGLRDAVDARRQLELRGRLNLRMDAADTPHDLDQVGRRVPDSELRSSRRARTASQLEKSRGSISFPP